MSGLTPNPKRKVTYHMNNSAMATDQNNKEGTDTNKETETTNGTKNNNNTQKEGETAAVESAVPATEKNNDQNEKEGTDTNEENESENNNNQKEGETAAADSLLELSGSSTTNLLKCCARDYCKMGVNIIGGVQHHCTECKGPMHGCLCSANGNGPNDNGTEMICLLCHNIRSKNKHTDDYCKHASSAQKDLSQKFNEAVVTGGSNDESDSDDTAEIIKQCPRRKQPEQKQASKGGGCSRGGSSSNEQSTPRLSLSSTSTSQTFVEIIDLDEVCSNDLEDTSNIEERAKVLVQLDFPPGAVGLHLAIIGTEAPFVKEIKPFCPLRNFLIGGETLVSINGTIVAGKTLNEIKQMFARLYQGVKTIVFSRYSIMQAPHIKKKKIVVAIKKKTKNGNKAAKQAPQSCAVSGDKVELGHNLRDMTAATKARQRPGQKVGNSATEMKHFKGRPAEYKKKQMFDCFDCYQSMISPVPVVDNNITQAWPKIWNVIIHRDPFKPSNAKGGPRTKDMRKSLRDKPEYYVVAPNMDVIKSAHRILGGLISSETDTDDFAIKYFTNGMKAYSASRYEEGMTRTANQRKLVPGCALPPDANKRMVNRTPYTKNTTAQDMNSPEKDWDCSSDDDK
jgi:hypothetical protein